MTLKLHDKLVETREEILATEPIETDENSDLEVHILTSRDDHLNALWALKSFYHFSEIRPRLVVHDDGSFDHGHVNIFKRHFTGSRVIDRTDADQEMAFVLNDRPYSRDYRKCSNCVHAIKLFDSFHYSETGKILFLDSDVLFFKKPVRMLNLINDSTGFYMEDWGYAYTHHLDVLKNQLDVNIISYINTGICHFPSKGMFNKDLVEKYLKLTHDHNYPRAYWTEQTALALLISQNQENFCHLDFDYQIGTQRLTDDTISHHYVNDASHPESRQNFTEVGIKQLRETGFLDAISK